MNFPHAEPALTHTLLGPDTAWRRILQARDHDWQHTPLLETTEDGCVLRIERGGTWHAMPAASTAARELFDLFLPLVAGTGVRTIGQLGQSLDGRIATETGHSHYINDPEALTHLHRLRAVVDAVLIGVGTANADNPLLTVRHVDGPQPRRVILDPNGRIRPDLNLLHDGTAPVLLIQSPASSHVAQACAHHVERIVLPLEGRGFSPTGILDTLAARGLHRILVEGGGDTLSRFVQAGRLDRLHLLVAPLLIGSGRPGLCLPPIDTLDSALRPVSRSYACGRDTIFDLQLR